MVQETRKRQNQEVVKTLSVLPKEDLVITVDGDQITLLVEKENLIRLLMILRDHTLFQFKIMSELTAVDQPTRDRRFDVVYQLLSIRYNTRRRVKVQCDERDLMPSVVSLYKFANQAEREVQDRFGIGFEGHPDLRRIMTDYGFEGHPRRKDFPLTGFTEVRYDELAKCVVSEPVERSQGFRAYNFQSPQKQLPETKLLKLGESKTTKEEKEKKEKI